MRKLIVVLLFLLFAYSYSSLVASSHVKKSFALPTSAQKISDNLYDLGEVEIGAKKAQGFAIIHRKDSVARPDGRGGGKIACWGFLSKDARWKTTESYVLDETNRSGMDPGFVASVSRISLDTWDSQVGFELFGDRVFGVVDGADAISPDGKNEIYFSEITDPGVIGVTTIWGYFGGSPAGRELIEYDVVFDDVDFIWGDATVNPLVMDYQNIATHELGHAAGLADLYTSSCAEGTMYGYAQEGETKKRDLNTGDIEGIQKLYR